MEPELAPADRVWFDPMAYRHRLPRAGELVILEDPDGSGRRLIKVVAASGGSRAWVVREGVIEVPKGATLDRPHPDELLDEVAVPPGQVFVTSR